MSDEIKYKKKELQKLIADDNERELCFLMLYLVYEEEAYSNLVIKKADKIASEEGKKIDFARAMLYGTLTYSFTIDFLIRHLTKEEVGDMDPVSRTVIRMAVWQIQFGNNIPAYAAVDSAVEITKKYNHKASGYVNAVLRKFADCPAEMRDLEQFKPGIRVALKPEIYGIFKKDFGKQTALEIGKALLEPAHITVRFDAHKTDRDNLIEELKKEGKVLHIGVSNFTREQIEEVQKTTELEVLQVQYSMLHRDNEELLKWAHAQGMGTMAYGALTGGLLTGRYRTVETYEASDSRNRFYGKYCII